MSFTSKKGRPQAKPILTIIEGGKQEMKPVSHNPIKRTPNEPIDICLEKGLITLNEYKAGVHFRWLYTIKFGAPGISAVEYDKLSNHHAKAADPEWQELREREYAMAVEKLRQIGALKMVLNLVVFSYYPSFLINFGKKSCGKDSFSSYSEITKMREGLDLLVKHWEEYC